MTREDPDVAAEMQRIFTDEGIQILVAAETLNVHGRSGEEVNVTVPTASGEQKIEGSDILVAAGRIPNTAGIGLEDIYARCNFTPLYAFGSRRKTLIRHSIC
jgi:pyruvate/2-oxoglutarate dehydrogenase complex dihydrolipoamide dehydrogenase (E3) component